MSESQDGTILGPSGPLEMNMVALPKMDPAPLEQLGLAPLGSGPQHYTPASSASPQTLLEGVMASGSRTLGTVSTAGTFSGSGGAGQESYGSLEYVTQMPLSEAQAKFPEALVSVDNVSFVEMNEAAIKTGGASGQLELYFDVIGPAGTAPPHTAAASAPPGHHGRHEHQTPKAQLLERAYTDLFLQQQQEEQQQQQQQQHNAAAADDDDEEEEEPNHILPDINTPSLAQLEPDALPSALHDYHTPRKTIKLEKRTILSSCSTSSSTTTTSTTQHSHHHNLHHQHHHQQQHEEQQQHQQRQFQHPHRLQQQQQQQQHKSFQLQSTQVRTTQALQQQHVQQQGKSPDSSEAAVSAQQGLQQQQQHLPLVSRSGRPIRRRPEYVEYVSQNLKEEQECSLPPGPPLPPPLEVPVKVEALGGMEFEEEEVPEEEEDIPQEEDGDSGEEDLEGAGGLCSGDGSKKSLPHKKRIPRKLKAARRHKCGQCGRQFCTQGQLATHRLTHTAPPPASPAATAANKAFRCEICGRGLDTQLKFFEHLKGHYEPNKRHRCEVCAGEFESARALQEHSSVHSREHFKCELCNKTFRKESMLEVHLRVAHVEEEEEGAGGAQERPYSCLACPKSFRTQMALDTHVQSQHGDDPPEFNCEDCYRAFKSKAKLTSHRRTEHKEEAPQTKGAPRKKAKVGKAVKGGYACTMCPRVFTHKNSLVYHIRGHTGERPHQCEQCGKSFYAASALKVHLRLHSGEKPYKCQMCDKYFRQWGDLRYHTTSVHSEKRQYQCEFCGKDFKRKYCLMVHRRIHTGEKNYKCEYCGKAFRAACYLQNHKRIHTGERPHPCPDCGKPFRVRSDMKRHRQTHMRDGTGAAPTPAPPHVTTQGAGTPHSPSHTVTAQLVPGTITQAATTSQPQLILSDQVSVPGSGEQPIRIMVSGLNAQQVAAAVHPPPAHRHSQHVTAVPVSGNIATLTTGPVSPGGTTTTTTLSPEVIIMDDNTHQPINLNIIPRMIASADQVAAAAAASSPHSSNHATLVTEEEVGEYQLANPGRNPLEVRGEEGSMYVWHGVFTN